MKLHVVMHESFESPAAILRWASDREHELTYTRLYLYEKLPMHSNDFDFLIVMGGPQSPATTSDECGYFNAEKEISLIKLSVESGKLVLGVCLGAQLMGEAFGAEFESSPNKEIGFFNLNLTDEAKTDPIFSDFPASFLVGHWHSDMPGLKGDSKVLASSKGCPRQIVRYAPGVYGFQCHFEFTKTAIEEMILHGGSELEKSKGLAYVQSPEMLLAHDYSAINNLLFKFLDGMCTLYE